MTFWGVCDMVYDDQTSQYWYVTLTMLTLHYQCYKYVHFMMMSAHDIM